ncbi:MAG: hypothetical protein Q4F65_10305, partial [Propionibacteriaceae bacterium]|nr:hypothetical protein [Propionibacteriaceae bacterium]
MNNLSRALLAGSGVAFALFPLLRPWSDKTAPPAGMAVSFADPLWIVAHSLGAAGFVLFAAGLVVRAGESRSGRLAAWLAGAGAALVLPFFGAETFGLAAVAGTVAPDQVPALADAVRNGPVALGSFALGLLAVAASGVVVAVERWRSGARRWAGLPLALGLATYLPQFFLQPVGRITHGLLLLA